MSDAPILSLGFGMLVGGLATTWIRAAILLMLHRQKFHWSLLLPTPQPVIVTIPPALIAAAFIFGRLEWTASNLVALMMAAGLSSYVFAIVWYHHVQLRGWGESIRFNEHLLKERAMLIDTINNNLIATQADPNAWLDGFRDMLSKQEHMFEEFKTREAKIKEEIESS